MRRTAWMAVGTMWLSLIGCMEPAGEGQPAPSPDGLAGDVETPDAAAVDGASSPELASSHDGTPDLFTEVLPPSPCLTAAPTNAQFGGKLCNATATLDVDLTACAPTTVTGFEMVASPSPEAHGLPTSDNFSFTPPPDGPAWTLADGQTVTLQLHYSPAGDTGVDADGKPIVDAAGLAVSVEGATEPLLVVPTSGFPVQQACPLPVIEVPDPGPYLVGTPIQLDGTPSMILSCEPTGADAYEWTAITADGASAVFDDSAAAMPTLTVDTPGGYLVRLRIYDAWNVQSCQDAEVLLDVVAQ